MKLDVLEAEEQALAEVAGEALAFLRHPLLSELLFLIDHAQGEGHKDKAGKDHGKKKEKDLFAMTARLHKRALPLIRDLLEHLYIRKMS